LLIVDTRAGDWKAVANPDQMRSGSGMTMVALIIANHCQVLLTPWCSPIAEKYLSNAGVRIVTGLHSRTAVEVVDEFQRIRSDPAAEKNRAGGLHDRAVNRLALTRALGQALRQIESLLPVLIGVILLLGLFHALVPRAVLFDLFTGHGGQDAFRGALVGSLFTGNPINSYIAGAGMLDAGIGIGAVTAFICAWVMVGLVQLPAEASALGWRFAIVRNAGCFILSVVIAWIMGFLYGFF
jgi:uncharacterized membrane protein YraQ (UPF0718 family)